MKKLKSLKRTQKKSKIASIGQRGSSFFEVLTILFILSTSSTFLLDSYIQSTLLWQAIIESKSDHNKRLTKEEAHLLDMKYEQVWADIQHIGELAPL